MFLSLASVFEGIATSGPLRTMLDSFTALLRDPARSILHLVTLPRALPVQETVELHATLLSEGNIALGHLFVNRVPERFFDVAEEAELERFAESMPLEVALAKRHMRDVRRSDLAQARLRALDLPLVLSMEVDEPNIPALAEGLPW
jgi:hypothetical protein